MKLRLIDDADTRKVFDRANQLTRRFIVRLTCCGRDDGTFGPAPWKECDNFREAYVATHGHVRAGIIEPAPDSASDEAARRAKGSEER